MLPRRVVSHYWYPKLHTAEVSPLFPIPVCLISFLSNKLDFGPLWLDVLRVLMDN